MRYQRCARLRGHVTREEYVPYKCVFRPLSAYIACCDNSHNKPLPQTDRIKNQSRSNRKGLLSARNTYSLEVCCTRFRVVGYIVWELHHSFQLE